MSWFSRKPKPSQEEAEAARKVAKSEKMRKESEAHEATLADLQKRLDKVVIPRQW